MLVKSEQLEEVQRDSNNPILYFMVSCSMCRFIQPKVHLIELEVSLLTVGLGESKSLIWVEGDAEALNFDDNSMDGYTIAFGIRNVTHIEKVLSEAYR